MAANNHTNNHTNGASYKGSQDTLFAASTELADLGRARFDHDTAAIGDRDSALFVGGAVHVRPGRAASGLDAQVFAWTAFQYETEDRNEREELKGDLHGGQLHRQNRAARGELAPPPPTTIVRAAGRGGRGYAGVRGVRQTANVGTGSDGLKAGMKLSDEALPLAKGISEELSADLFWKEESV
ncbi:hypothetical protein K458DRAFT_303387 [Lentithecium fluviatile CBS 122367]|uniref:Uncharacterized protein n=1 Tax=Lentithecium fluviatile CBS 122367 TaxID=1168545 RepID=A0A6G1J1A4_9PLEO|nr:hypothetical protein K458DRAFT_303387 [Lentithecium fluviatile CBS 122367]